jgi:hypothetical protein
MDENKTVEAPLPELDERAIARKYGLRELSFPGSEHVKTLAAFFDQCLDSGRCGPVPRTTVVMVLEFLQATINRQHITKGPRMSQEEFDVLQTPYYVAARVVSKIQRARQDDARGKLYQTTYISLNHFIDLLRNLIDPSCIWLRHKGLPEPVRESMQALRHFLLLYPEQRRKGRAT